MCLENKIENLTKAIEGLTATLGSLGNNNAQPQSNPIVAQQASEALDEIAELVEGVIEERKPNSAKSTVKKTTTKAKTNKVYKLEDVRACLADLSKKGKKELVKELLSEFGASKLSDVDKKDYKALMKRVEEER